MLKVYLQTMTASCLRSGLGDFVNSSKIYEFVEKCIYTAIENTYTGLDMKI